MTRIAKTLLSTFTLVTVSAFAMQVNADAYGHIEDMAQTINKKASRLVGETNHYRKTAQYRQILDDTRELRNHARDVRNSARRRNNLADIQKCVAEMDRLFCRLEGLFDQAELEAARGCGRIIGNTAHVKAELIEIEGCLRCMQEDIHTLRLALNAPRPRTYATTVPVTRVVPLTVPVRVTPDYGFSSRGGCSGIRGGYDRYDRPNSGYYESRESRTEVIYDRYNRGGNSSYGGYHR